MNQASEAQVQQKLVQTPEAQHLLHWRARRRATMALGLVVAPFAREQSIGEPTARG